MSSRTKGILTLAVIAVAAAGGYYLFRFAQEKKALADETASNIKSELDNLDPATRAAVIAKLSSDEVARYRGKK
jgi:hypothetical protein